MDEDQRKESFVNKIFFPLNISYVQSQRKTSRLVAILFCIALTLILLVVAYVIYQRNRYYTVLGTIPGLIVMMLIALILGLEILQIFGIKRKKVVQIYQEAMRHEITTIQDMYNVNTIEHGKMYCYDQSMRVIIRCERGYILNRPESAFVDHQVAVGQFLGSLLGNDYEVTLFNMCYESSNAEHLVHTERNLQKLNNPNLKSIGRDFIKFYRTTLTGLGKSVEDYYVVSATDQNLQAHMMNMCYRAMDCLKGSLYIEYSICEEKDIIELNEQLLKIKGINVKELRFGGELVKNSNVFRIAGFYDTEGNFLSKEYLDDIQEKFEEDERKREAKEAREAEAARKKILAEMQALEQEFQASSQASEEDVVPIADEDVVPIVEEETISVEDTKDASQPTSSVFSAEDVAGLSANVIADLDAIFKDTPTEVSNPPSTPSTPSTSNTPNITVADFSAFEGTDEEEL